MCIAAATSFLGIRDQFGTTFSANHFGTSNIIQRPIWNKKVVLETDLEQTKSGDRFGTIRDQFRNKKGKLFFRDLFGQKVVFRDHFGINPYRLS